MHPKGHSQVGIGSGGQSMADSSPYIGHRENGGGKPLGWRAPSCFKPPVGAL